MIPNSLYGIGLLGLMASLTLRPARERTDADRLRDLDTAEERYQAKITAPAYIAAQEKRDRKRLKLLSSTN